MVNYFSFNKNRRASDLVILHLGALQTLEEVGYYQGTHVHKKKGPRERQMISSLQNSCEGANLTPAKVSAEVTSRLQTWINVHNRDCENAELNTAFYQIESNINAVIEECSAPNPKQLEEIKK